MYAELAFLVPALPFIAFVLTLFIWKRDRMWAGGIGIALMAAAFALSLLILQETLAGARVDETWAWFLADQTDNAIAVGFLVDPLAAVMLVMVTLISLLVQIYSLGYMHGEEGLPRYFSQVSLFTCAMLGVVVANNILVLFIFWELVGLCSYLLIGFWYRKPEAASAAKKAFLVTRVGDVLFLAGIFVIWSNVGALTFTDIFAAIPVIDQGQLTLACLLLFGGAIGKSGQFPLHVWLPDAMEGPTTVSALIHAATMVTAGVYLVARTLPMFLASPDALITVAYIGAFTAIFAATMGLVMWDIKRVLAYSTVSQLGYMMLALGVGALGAGIFHLISHAFFKALLFLSAGAVIHSVATNDMRLMGGLSGKMKLTSFVMLIGSLSLAGIPPFSGFFSKDEILLETYMNGDMLLYAMVILAALLTAFYIFRLWFLTFTGSYRGKARPHEAPKTMILPCIMLAILVCVFGLFAVPFVSFVGDTHTEGAVTEHLVTGSYGALTADEVHHAPIYIEVLPIVMGVGGIALAALTYVPRVARIRPQAVVDRLRPVHTLLSKRYYIDHLYLAIAEKVGFGIAWVLNKFDVHVIDGAVNGIATGFIGMGKRTRRLQTGIVENYMSFVLLGLLLLVFILWLLGVF